MPNSTPSGCNGPGRLSYMGAPRPVPLHHRATRAQMKPGLYPSLDETRGPGHEEPTSTARFSGLFGTASRSIPANSTASGSQVQKVKWWPKSELHFRDGHSGVFVSDVQETV